MISVKTVFMTLVFFLITTLCSAEITLQWDANTEPDLAGYNVYQTMTPGDYGEPRDSVSLETKYVITDTIVTCIYWVVTAFDLEGLESDYSNEVSNCDGIKPSAPGVLQINITINIVNQ